MAVILSELDESGLVKTLIERQHELVRTRFALNANQLENTASIRNIRRYIARLQTEIRKREMAQELPKDSLVVKHRKAFGGGQGSTSASTKTSFLKGVVDSIES